MVHIRQLGSLSLVLTVIGVALVLLGVVAQQTPTVTLIGLLLVIAGGVKMIVVYLWRDIVSGPGLDDRSTPTLDAD